MKFVNLGLFLVLSIVSSTPLSPALLLSPLIANNKTLEARNLSSVDPKLFLNVSSHAGFLTVEEKYDTNTFFWYFPVAGKPVNETPWIVWLQGGPGATSLAGLFDEIGPFEYKDKELKLREVSWTKEYSVLFIDNPVGAGYSFTNDSRGYVTDMETCANHLYSALTQFLQLFPELSKTPLYIAGESYAGRYLPALGMKIFEENKGIETKGINLQGIIMGNPVLGRQTDEDYTALFFQWGLIDAQGKLAVKPLQDEYIQAVHNNDSAEAAKKFDELLDRLQNIAMKNDIFNVLNDANSSQLEGFMELLHKEEIKKAIHVGDANFTFSNGLVHTKLVNDFLRDSTPHVTALLDHYKILIYCGQLDMMAACTPNSQVRRDKWFWSHRDDFMKEPRTPWWYQNSVAGFVKQGGGFTEVLVKNAGHMVPMDKPEAALKLISLFIKDEHFPMPKNYFPSPMNTPNYNITDTEKNKNNTEPEIKNNTIPEIKNNTKPENNNSIKPENNKSIQPENNYHGPMVASIVINVVLVLVIAAGAVYVVKWKRRTAAMYYSAVDDSSLSDAVLTMT